MTHSFDKDYWELHWEQAHDATPADPEVIGPNPYLVRETSGLVPGTALDAGCGTGAEAIWLASRGWLVTGADISGIALAQASRRAAKESVSNRLTLVEADLTVWDPGLRFDLVATSYAHPAMPQLAFYGRISEWVAPGGALLIIGHLHDDDSTGHGHHPPAGATTTLADIAESLGTSAWRIETSEQQTRTLTGQGGRLHPLRDVIVRATRLR